MDTTIEDQPSEMASGWSSLKTARAVPAATASEAMRTPVPKMSRRG